MKFGQFVPKVLSGNQILTSVKGHNSITKVQKMMCSNPNLDLVDFNTYTKFGEILSFYSEDIERKRNMDNQNPV